MTDFEKMDIFQGMKIKIGIDQSISWSPNKFAGNHGAQFKIIDKNGLTDLVLAKKPNGSIIKISRNSEIFIFEEGRPLNIGKINSIPQLSFEKLNPNPDNISPGMLWVGPFDGEKHHFSESRFWIKNIKNKRCHYKEVPEELKSKLEIYKPEGGSFVVTPWNHVIALISVRPLPEDTREQWEKLTKEERRLLQIKQAGANMLPIYICEWNKEWNIELNDPIDYNKPLSTTQENKMLDFLSQYSTSKSKKPNKIIEDELKKIDKEEEVKEEEWSDDDEFFDENALDLMYTPSDD
mgnify:CR=1 FL=1